MVVPPCTITSITVLETLLPSATSTTGALLVSGGAGIAGALCVGGQATFSGGVVATVTGTASGNALTGAMGSSGLTMATAKLLGRGTAATGAIEEITLGTGLSLAGTTLSSVNSASPVTYPPNGGNVSVTGGVATVNGNYTIDFNVGQFQKVTTGSAAATITIPDWASATVSVDAWLYITQGATARVQTLGAASGTNNNIISSGGLASAGVALPNSGANTTDAFQFTWTGAKWMVTNALYDVKV